MQYSIYVNNLTKRFGTFTAVDNIDFDVRHGEIFGFLGANGAGKTTTMRMLCGLSVPTTGTGYVAGCDINTQYEDIKRHIGYMSQRFSLYNNLTVEENIYLSGGIYGLSRQQIRVLMKERLDRLEFYDERKTLVGRLPVGWKQKLAFTVAMLHNPEVVFLDEPTGGVDPIARRQFWEMIHEASHNGTTIFVTTHYMDEAMYCNRIAIIADGHIRALDTPEAIIKAQGAVDMDDAFVKINTK